MFAFKIQILAWIQQIFRLKYIRLKYIRLKYIRIKYTFYMFYMFLNIL